MPKPPFYSLYYPNTPTLRGWPFRIRSLGYNNYAPFAKFPSGSHPEDHLFSWESGRVLSTLTLVHVTDGKGRFRSQPSGTLTVPRNTAIVVFPSVRHAYGPDLKTGWSNQWVEVEAESALPLLKQAGLTPRTPLKTFRPRRISRVFFRSYWTSRASRHSASSRSFRHARTASSPTCLRFGRATRPKPNISPSLSGCGSSS